MDRESHATVSAGQTSSGWGATGRESDFAAESERGEAAERAIPHLVEEPDRAEAEGIRGRIEVAARRVDAADADAEEALPVTPDLVAYFDSTIKQLRSEIAALRTALEERTTAAEHKKARMVTLNMALNGAPREEAERYLSENFRLADAGPILDDAYGRDAS